MLPKINAILTLKIKRLFRENYCTVIKPAKHVFPKLQSLFRRTFWDLWSLLQRVESFTNFSSAPTTQTNTRPSTTATRWRVKHPPKRQHVHISDTCTSLVTWCHKSGVKALTDHPMFERLCWVIAGFTIDLKNIFARSFDECIDCVNTSLILC